MHFDLAVTPQWVAEHFLTVHLLDTRESPAEHVPSAVHIPVSSLAATLGSVDADCYVVIIDENDDAALRAVAIVQSLGFDRVAYLAGGMGRWLEEGRPAQTGRAPAPTLAHRERRRAARDPR